MFVIETPEGKQRVAPFNGRLYFVNGNNQPIARVGSVELDEQKRVMHRFYGPPPELPLEQIDETP